MPTQWTIPFLNLVQLSTEQRVSTYCANFHCNIYSYLCCKLIKFTYSSYKNIVRSMKCITFKLIQCMVYCIKRCSLESRQNNVTAAMTAQFQHFKI